VAQQVETKGAPTNSKVDNGERKVGKEEFHQAAVFHRSGLVHGVGKKGKRKKSVAQGGPFQGACARERERKKKDREKKKNKSKARGKLREQRNQGRAPRAPGDRGEKVNGKGSLTQRK